MEIFSIPLRVFSSPDTSISALYVSDKEKKVYNLYLYNIQKGRRVKRKKADREGLLKHHLLKAMLYIVHEGL